MIFFCTYVVGKEKLASVPSGGGAVAAAAPAAGGAAGTYDTFVNTDISYPRGCA